MLRNKCNNLAYPITLFVLYIICLFKITIIRNGIRFETLLTGRLNLIPFEDLIMVYQNNGLWKFIYLFIGNIIWFIPLGFLLPFIYKKFNLSKIVIYGFLLSVAIESMQFIFGTGISETDDLILNTLGTYFGYLVYKMWDRNFKSLKLGRSLR